MWPQAQTYQTGCSLCSVHVHVHVCSCNIRSQRSWKFKHHSYDSAYSLALSQINTTVNGILQWLSLANIHLKLRIWYVYYASLAKSRTVLSAKPSEFCTLGLNTLFQEDQLCTIFTTIYRGWSTPVFIYMTEETLLEIKKLFTTSYMRRDRNVRVLKIINKRISSYLCTQHTIFSRRHTGVEEEVNLVGYFQKVELAVLITPRKLLADWSISFSVINSLTLRSVN